MAYKRITVVIVLPASWAPERFALFFSPFGGHMILSAGKESTVFFNMEVMLTCV